MAVFLFRFFHFAHHPPWPHKLENKTFLNIKNVVFFSPKITRKVMASTETSFCLLNNRHSVGKENV